MDATFTPAETALYKFESLNYGEKYIDTTVEFYEDGKYITTDNEDGNNVNFSLIYQLEEGKKYTYRVRASRGLGLSIPFIVSFDKVSGNTIKSAKLVLRDGKKAEDLDVTKSIGEFY